MNDGEIVPPKLTIQMQRFPYPLWVNDLFYISQMETMVSILIMISFLYNYINIIRAITTEKEKQLKESMKIMGLPGWLHWLAWFLQSFIILLLALILIEILLKINIGKAVVFPHSNGGVLFVFFVLFACNTITFAFLVSVFFSKGEVKTDFVKGVLTRRISQLTQLLLWDVSSIFSPTCPTHCNEDHLLVQFWHRLS
jgi:ATP-binding cassette subfamily A (ABC1) protein 3